jgi:hypothetical protein
LPHQSSLSNPPNFIQNFFTGYLQTFLNVAQEQSLEYPDNDAEILLIGKLVIRFQENKILMAFSQLLKIYEILVGLPMPCMCPTLIKYFWCAPFGYLYFFSIVIASFAYTIQYRAPGFKPTTTQL